MSEQNPDIVLEAITDAEKSYSSVTINVPTIRRYAYLEKLKSPFVFSDVPFDLENVIPSIYILAVDNTDLRKLSGKPVEDISNIAFDWADEKLDLKDVPKIIEDVVKTFTSLNDAAPQSVSDPSKKA